VKHVEPNFVRGEPPKCDRLPDALAGRSGLEALRSELTLEHFPSQLETEFEVLNRAGLEDPIVGGHGQGLIEAIERVAKVSEYVVHG
jgi:hypothetical protein